MYNTMSATVGAVNSLGAASQGAGTDMTRVQEAGDALRATVARVEQGAAHNGAAVRELDRNFAGFRQHFESTFESKVADSVEKWAHSVGLPTMKLGERDKHMDERVQRLESDNGELKEMVMELSSVTSTLELEVARLRDEGDRREDTMREMGKKIKALEKGQGK